MGMTSFPVVCKNKFLEYFLGTLGCIFFRARFVYMAEKLNYVTGKELNVIMPDWSGIPQQRSRGCFKYTLTLKAPITTAADDIHKYFLIVYQINKT